MTTGQRPPRPIEHSVSAPSSAPPADEQARIYHERADAYDELVSAEDADGVLAGALLARVPRGARVADIGGGTGRITRLVAAHAARVEVLDRAQPMLDVAARRLAQLTPPLDFALHCSDARALPLQDATVDVAIAGWVFGHFRLWMPEGWQDEVSRALDEMSRITRPGGTIIVIETLGTGHTAPRTHHALDAYFAHLEQRGFRRSWLRTDYAFASAAEAARVCGAFFGEELRARIEREGSERVPECTALFELTRDTAAAPKRHDS